MIVTVITHINFPGNPPELNSLDPQQSNECVAESTTKITARHTGSKQVTMSECKPKPMTLTVKSPTKQPRAIVPIIKPKNRQNQSLSM